MAERCKHDMVPDQCGSCHPPQGLSTAEMMGLGPWVEADYPGRCSANPQHRIQPGDQIRSDGDGGWLCRECGSY